MYFKKQQKQKIDYCPFCGNNLISWKMHNTANGHHKCLLCEINFQVLKEK